MVPTATTHFSRKEKNMELVTFLDGIRGLEEFFLSCSENERAFLNATAFVASRKLSKSSQLLFLGEGIEKVLEERRHR